MDAEELDEEGTHDHPYCEAVPGIAPHNYQPVLDPFGGTGLWLYCTQCGEHYNVDGTAIVTNQAGTLGQTPTPSPAAAPASNGAGIGPSGTGMPKPSGLPFG